MKVLKLIFAALATLVLLLVILAAVLFITFDADRLRQQISSTVEQQTGRTLVLSDDISLSVWPQIAVRIGASHLTEPRSDVIFARWERVNASVEVRPMLRGEIVVRTASFEGLEANLLQSANGSLNIDDLLALATSRPVAQPQSPSTALPRLQMDGIELQNARLTYKDAQGNITRVQLKFHATHIAGEADVVAIERVSIDATVETATEKASLQLHTPLHMQLAESRVDLTGLRGSLTLHQESLPEQRLDLPIAGQASVNWADSTAQARLDSQLYESPVKLNLEITAFSPLTFELDLDVERLNLDRFTGSTGTPQRPNSPGSGPAPTAIDLTALDALNGQARIRVGQLQVNGLKLSELQLAMAARQGQVNVSSMTADLYQGKLRGSARLLTASNRLTLRQSITGVAISPLLRDLASNDMLEGNGNVVLDLNTQGATTNDWIRALQGTARIELESGAIRGINLAQTVRNAQQLLGGSRSVDLNTDNTQKTDFSELSASFTINRGIATNRDLTLKAPLLRLSGEGVIHLPDQTLNYLLRPTLVATTQGQGGREAGDLRGLTVPVRLTGPLTEPRWRLEIGSAVTGTLRTTVQEKVEDRLPDHLQDTVRDRVRNIIRR